MMKLVSVRALVGAVVVTVTVSSARSEDPFVEPFDEGNEGQWSWGTGNEEISPLNGNPGAFLQDLTLDTCCPGAGTAFGVQSIFTGNYLESGVTSIGIDLITLHTPFKVGNRPLSIILTNDNNTPFNFNDDWGAFLVTDETIPERGVPGAPAGWTSYDIDIPVQSPTLPKNWRTFDENGLDGDIEWTELMADVDVVEFFYGDPALFYPFFMWDVGIDNARITFAPSCPTDLDDDGAVGPADPVTLLGAWGPCASCPADLNDDGDVGAGDLLTLLGTWGACP